MNLELMELIADVLEAIEMVQKYGPLYRAVLKETGSKEQAIAAVKYVARMAEELERDSA